MNQLVQLNLPKYDFRMRSAEGVTQVWDAIRRKWLVLTPEEWVRQNFIRYMIEELGVSANYVIQEHIVKIATMSQRADILVRDPNNNNVMVVECKAADVAIDDSVFAQVVRYNSVIGAEYVVLTNGIRHICCRRCPDGAYTQLGNFPDLSSIF